MEKSKIISSEWLRPPSPEAAVVVGRLGGRVELACAAAEPRGEVGDDEPSLLLWFHESRPATPLYSVDGRQAGGLAGAQHSMADAWAARAYFSSVSRTLRLEQLSPEDQGRYRCRVDFRRGRTRTSTLTLVVRGTLRHHGRARRGAAGNRGPTQRRRPAGPRLHCPRYRSLSRRGRPPPVISWWQDARMLLDNDSANTFDGDVSRSVLHIDILQRSLLMAHIICKARSGDEEEEASITLDINLRPLGVAIAPPETVLVAEQPAQIRCDSWGSRPAANLSWWMGSRRMTRSAASVDESSGRTSSVLAFTPAGDDHGRRLRCRAANERVPGSAIEDALFLEVEFPPSVRLRVVGGSAVDEGSDSRFECSVRAHPELLEPPRWLWEGRPLSAATTGLRHRAESNGTLHVLTLLGVRRSQRGRYCCLARNARGKALSAPVTLHVLYAPRCVPNQRHEYQAALHQTVLVRCRVEAEPAAPTLFGWTFAGGPNEQPLTLLDHTRSAGGLESHIRYVPRSELDYGTLACLASNTVGMAEAPCFFSVLAPAPRCRVVQPGPRLACVTASPIVQGASLLVQLRDPRGILRASLRSTQPVILLKGTAFNHHLLATAFVVSASGQRSAASTPIHLFPTSLEEHSATARSNKAAVTFFSCRFTIVIVVSWYLRLQTTEMRR
ncbi:hemicentin-1-like [Dermacentor andersoni]|uniref:hemicentin-1-like n=1 Tax=Dermacentor andersoni TaxID=34620 RepID=UPI003B3A3896